MPIPTERTKPKFELLNLIILLSGIAKIGKTTFVSGLGRILFVFTEPGYKFLEVMRWSTENGEDPTTWEHIRQAIKEIADSKEFDMVAFDTLDNLFKLCEAYVMKKHKIDHPSDLAFGKGYSIVATEFHNVITYLAQRGKGIIFITHTKTSDKTVKNKTFSYTDISVPETCKKVVVPLADLILHATVDDSGNRILITKGNENLNAGDRSGRLPAVIPLDAQAFKDAFNEVR